MQGTPKPNEEEQVRFRYFGLAKAISDQNLETWEQAQMFPVRPGEDSDEDGTGSKV